MRRKSLFRPTASPLEIHKNLLERQDIVLRDVSIIMCVYNEKLDLLKAAVSSILGQCYKGFELIIVDDSDKTEVIGFLADISKKNSNVLYMHNESRLGFVKSLNKGLSLAKGEFIARTDSDDVSKKQRLMRQILFLKKHKDIGIVGSSFEKITDDGRRLNVRKYPSSPERIKKTMMIKNAVAHSTVMIRSEVFESIGCYNEQFSKAEDYELWMRAIKRGVKIANLEEPLVDYRISNTTKRDVVNWRNNLKVKLQYFGFDYLGYRIIGILIVSVMLILPSFLKGFVYSIYNRIA